jgi:hypothetical protein
MGTGFRHFLKWCLDFLNIIIKGICKISYISPVQAIKQIKKQKLRAEF